MPKVEISCRLPVMEGRQCIGLIFQNVCYQGSSAAYGLPLFEDKFLHLRSRYGPHPTDESSTDMMRKILLLFTKNFLGASCNNKNWIVIFQRQV
jgi:hypothetical protein